uniref:ubiquitinyl hydrolase 1 n=1 Tax=Clastoptera arizonana TaxID=38151 RepID=A0A1B6CF67_9HEMI
MDREHIFILAGITACALSLSIFVLWGPKPKSFRRGPLVGLQNLGFTCFLNSLLQALASCAFFLQWVENCKGQGKLSDTLLNVLQILSRERSKADDIDEPYSPIEVISAFKQHGFAMEPVEQDAHELFCHILDILEEEAQTTMAPSLNGCLSDALSPEEAIIDKCVDSLGVNSLSEGDTHLDTEDGVRLSRKAIPEEGDRPSSFRMKMCPLDKNRNPAPSPFRGLLTSQLVCSVCKFKSKLLNDKLDSLSLHLPESRNSHTLIQLLENYFKAEPVSGVVCDMCNQGQQPGQAPITTTSIKTLSIGKLPRCLCLHIPRTSMGPYGTPFKRQDFVDFPEFLTMDNYTTNNRLKQQMTMEKNHICLDSTDRNLNIQNCHHLYRLKAVIVHKGCVERGHFVTYRRGPLHSNTRHRWYVTSDSEIKDSTLFEVLQSTPYMLFYEKCTDPPS